MRPWRRLTEAVRGSGQVGSVVVVLLMLAVVGPLVVYSLRPARGPSLVTDAGAGPVPSTAPTTEPASPSAAPSDTPDATPSATASGSASAAAPSASVSSTPAPVHTGLPEHCTSYVSACAWPDATGDVPPAVTGVQAVARAGTLTVTWDPVTAGAVTSYVVRLFSGGASVYAPPALTRQVGAGDRSVSVTDLRSGHYLLAVAALGGDGLGAAATETITVSGAGTVTTAAP